MHDPFVPDGVQILVLTTVDTLGLLQLSALLRTLPPLGREETRILLLAEPLDAATLERWLTDDGRLRQHQVILPARHPHG